MTAKICVHFFCGFRSSPPLGIYLLINAYASSLLLLLLLLLVLISDVSTLGSLTIYGVFLFVTNIKTVLGIILGRNAMD